MNLDRVTMTGADNSILPEDLFQISVDYPFVEWGILASASNQGVARFPSHGWIKELQGLAKATSIKLSLHLCGRWVRELLAGEVTYPIELLDQFQRVQLNFHRDVVEINREKFIKALESFGDRQVIFQLDGSKGRAYLNAVRHSSLDLVPLFDTSGGAGVLPLGWPEPEYSDDVTGYLYHGYAGGLGPDNLAEQLPMIGRASNNAPIWIDMETKVRSPDDRQFDLAKVEQCLEICKPFCRVSV